MRVSTTLAAMALIAGTFTFLAPAVGALDLGCVRADESGHIEVTTLPAGSATLFTAPGQDITGWTPECVIIPNGGTVSFVQRDAIGHGVVSDDLGQGECIKLGVMSIVGGTPAAPSAPATTSLTVDFDVTDGFAYLVENGNSYNACEFESDGSTVTIPYHCQIHGLPMPGIIKIEL